MPPTIKSPQAERGGLSVTLFERIIRDQRFAAVVRLLDIQYRMHHSISDWASEQMYRGAIISHESVAHHTLRDIIGGARVRELPDVEGESNQANDVEKGGESEEDGDSIDTLADIAASVDNASLDEEDTYPVMLLVDTSGLGMLEDSTVSPGSSSSTANVVRFASSRRRRPSGSGIKGRSTAASLFNAVRCGSR